MNSSTTITSGIPVTEGLVFLPDAAEYCDKHKLHALVGLAAQLASSHFTLIRPIEVELEIDPDADEQKPILNLTVAGSVEEVERRYQAYVFEWVGQVRGDAALSVGTSLNIVENSNEPA